MISIVTPTFNESENIENFCNEVSKKISESKYDYEHIVIDNSSNDGTIEILKELCKKDPFCLIFVFVAVSKSPLLVIRIRSTAVSDAPVAKTISVALLSDAKVSSASA